MNEKRFIVETVEITDCDTDVSRIAKVITDKEEIYSYDDLYEISDLLNEQQAEIRLYQERVDMREEQLSIIKKHCLEMLSDEQFKLIKRDLENSIKEKVKCKFHISVTGD